MSEQILKGLIEFLSKVSSIYQNYLQINYIERLVTKIYQSIHEYCVRI
jgi:hypothetical protein